MIVDELSSPAALAVEVVGKRMTKLGHCIVHNKPMKDFRTKWVCDGPPQHTEAK